MLQEVLVDLVQRDGGMMTDTERKRDGRIMTHYHTLGRKSGIITHTQPVPAPRTVWWF
jgi:hypothetical protein